MKAVCGIVHALQILAGHASLTFGHVSRATETVFGGMRQP
jgi:hypothetical protein